MASLPPSAPDPQPTLGTLCLEALGAHIAAANLLFEGAIDEECPAIKRTPAGAAVINAVSVLSALRFNLFC